jgi:hypothetical protein
MEPVPVCARFMHERTANRPPQPSHGGTSRMMREYHVRICEGLGVQLPGSTRQARLMRRRAWGLCPSVPVSCMRERQTVPLRQVQIGRLRSALVALVPLVDPASRPACWRAPVSSVVATRALVPRRSRSVDISTRTGAGPKGVRRGASGAPVGQLPLKFVQHHTLPQSQLKCAQPQRPATVTDRRSRITIYRNHWPWRANAVSVARR